MLVLGAVCAVSVAIYLLASSWYFRIGFPLDDSWIHQTYARNLALNQEWAFLPGQPSGGSTSPLWTVLLSIGFLLGLSPYVWTFLLGWILLWGLALLGETALRRWNTAYRPSLPWAGILLAMEWHLVWAAVSGMETILQALIITAVLVMVASRSKRYLIQGLLVGLSVWIRPDGITLLGPVLLGAVVQAPRDVRQWLKALLQILFGFMVIFGFYLLFNLAVAGTAWPNTFYAKQAEYSSYLALPFLERVGQQCLQPVVGVGLVLVPGLISHIVRTIRKKDWGSLLGIVWVCGFLVLYAWRLPVVYQHGRYGMPVLPIFLLIGFAGLYRLFERNVFSRFLTRSWWILTGLILVGFLGRGALAFAQDVSYIESEMVDTAKWVSVSIPPDDLVAAHDIGALGYFGGHELVDLAGLINPEIVPIIRDEAGLTRRLDELGVAYLVVFPDWYETLTDGLRLVHSTQAVFAPTQGGTNLNVYRWPGP